MVENSSVGQEMTNNRFGGEIPEPIQKRVLRIASNLYFEKYKLEIKKFMVNGVEVLAETQEDAMEIYKRATKS